jgi:hypothetical protein
MDRVVRFATGSCEASSRSGPAAGAQSASIDRRSRIDLELGGSGASAAAPQTPRPVVVAGG